MSIGIWSAIIIILDQASKSWVRSSLQGKEAIVLIEDFFSLNYVENQGAAFGFLNNTKFGPSFLKIISLLLTFALIYLMRKVKYRKLQYALATIVGGSIGNLLDRFIFSFVTDFLSFNFGAYTFPSFNIADSCIVLGVIYFSYLMFFDKQAEDALTKALEGN